MSATGPSRVHGLELGDRRARGRPARARARGAPGSRRGRPARLPHRAQQSLDARRVRGAAPVALRRARRPGRCAAGLRSRGLARALRAGRVERAPGAVGSRSSACTRRSRGARVAVVGAGTGGALRGARARAQRRRGAISSTAARALARARPRPERVPPHARAEPRVEPALRRGRRGHVLRRQALHARRPPARGAAARGARRLRRAAGRSVYDARAHVGTDRLHRILPRLRARLEAAGVRFHWHTRVDGLVLDAARARAACRALATARASSLRRRSILAPGHSARDTWRALAEQGVVVRGQAVPARRADRAPAGARRPRAATATGPEAALLGPGLLRARRARRRRRARRAQLLHVSRRPDRRERERARVPLHERHEQLDATPRPSRTPRSSPRSGPREFGGGPFAGVALQASSSARFFDAGGRDYTRAGAARAGFPGRARSRAASCARATARHDARTHRRAAARRSARGAAPRARRASSARSRASPDRRACSSGSSRAAPARCAFRATRDTLRARGFANLFPVGEGAGYAGGIMSAAIDGARTAQALLRTGSDRIRRERRGRDHVMRQAQRRARAALRGVLRGELRVRASVAKLTTVEASGLAIALWTSVFAGLGALALLAWHGELGQLVARRTRRCWWRWARSAPRSRSCCSSRARSARARSTPRCACRPSRSTRCSARACSSATR